MKSRRNRPDIRSLRTRAGRAGSVREATFEALEERKLLFSFTITPGMDIDGDGLGTLQVPWGYTVPYIDTAIEPEEEVDVEEVLEDFNDEPANPTPVTNPYRLLGSDFLIRHSFNPTNDTFVFTTDPDEDDVFLNVISQGGEFFQFEPQIFPDDQDGPTPPGIARAATVAQFSVADADNRGLVPTLFRVEFYFGDELVDSYTGSELIAANQDPNNINKQNGIGAFRFEPGDPFTRMRIVALGAEDFRFDNVQFSFESNRFAEIVDSRIFGADLTFTAPIGATVQVLDLYGREMEATLALGAGDGDIPLVDPDGDGVPNFNDGIGRVIVTGVDSRASLTIFGGTIEFTDGAFVYTRTESFTGLFDEMKEAGGTFMAEYDDGEPTFYGLPTGPGSVFFGAPELLIRDNSSGTAYDPANAVPGLETQGIAAFVVDGFDVANQGIFVPNGESMGSIYVHGVMHGSSRFSGAVNDMYFGYLVGSVSVEGDLGTLHVGADAGMWISDEDAANAIRIASGSQLTVGRTLGEVAIGGRSQLNTTVVGDLADAVAHPPRDSFRFIEREKVFAFDDAENPEAAIMARIALPTSELFGDFGLFVDPGGRTPIFNTSTLRNDTLMGAEFVSSISSAVQISGTIGYGDPINAEDAVDMFGFAVSGLNPVAIQVNGIFGLVRILDQNGRPLAATEFLEDSLLSQTFTFNPPHAGVYYLEISDVGVGQVNGGNGSGFSYAVTIAGLAPVTMGSYRVAGSVGHDQMDEYPTIQTINGSMGAVRFGTAFTGPDGTDQDPSAVMNRPAGEDSEDEDQMDAQGSSVSSAGSLYTYVAGSDIRVADLFVTGDLGSMFVGMSPVVGGLAGDGLEGDVYGMIMQIGGRIGSIDIKGAVGINQDPDPIAYIIGIGLDMRTGVVSGNGDIGMIRIGSDVNGGTLTINTAPGSTVGGLLVSQDREEDRVDEGFHRGFSLPSDFSFGVGSDLRFVDFPRIDVLNVADHSFDLVTGQTVQLVDDGGGIVEIRIEGPISGLTVGAVRVLQADNGEGVAVARIDGLAGGGIDLSGGRSLVITGVGRVNGNSDIPISIGRIHISAADAQSDVLITGDIEVDVWSIISDVALDNITNNTPGGDIVSADVGGLNALEILDGDLGRTQVPAFGPQRIGEFLGIALGEQGTVRGALGVPEAVMSPIENLQGTFRPAGVITDVYLDDIGSPLDPYLNGLVVRTGNLNNVIVGRGIGDVILQGGGSVQTITANADFIRAGTGLEGIFGHIYAQNIDTVNVGAGLAGGGRAPFVQAGIFASDEIRNINADALTNPGAFLSGVIVASNLTANLGPDSLPEVGGIGDINVSEGIIDGAYIGGMLLDSFLVSYAAGEGTIYAGNIGTIGGTNLTIFRSEIEADFLGQLELGDGVYDATVMSLAHDVDQLDIGTARNSTLSGGTFEFHFNTISIGRNIGAFTGGDIRDLRVEAVGSVTGSVTGDTWRRVEMLVSGNVPSITIAQSMVSSSLSLGQLGTLAANAIRTSEVRVSGEMATVTAATEIYNTEFVVSGPAGEIGTITAAGNLSGSIVASGPVGVVSSTGGDVVMSVTTTGNRGTVGQFIAARDLVLDTDISRGVDLLQAGRHLGRPNVPGMIFVRGNLVSVTTGGHLFTDVRVGGVLHSATIGPVVNRPGAEMGRSGSLYGADGVGAVAITGDFGGGVVAYSGGIQSVTLTNGSLLPTGSVRSYDGNVESLVINAGNLYGDVYADWSILSLQVLASADGVFGDIGINPSLTAGAAYDAFRNQLPPGIAPTSGQDGPSIRAGHNVASLVVSNGSVYEATIHAGDTVGLVDINGRILSDGVTQNTGRTVIAAGETIDTIRVRRAIRQAQIMAGVRSFGDDMLPGGFGDDADVINAGRINRISAGGDITNTDISAGMLAGADRLYNTADDLQAIGFSTVGPISIGGVGTGSSVYSDTLLGGATAGGKLLGRGATRPVAHDDIASGPAGTELDRGSSFGFSTTSGSGTIVFTGPGRAFFDSATNRVILIGTTLSSSLVVSATGNGVLTDFDIVSTDGASMGLVRVEAALAGDSDIVIDDTMDRVQIGAVFGEGTIQAGRAINGFVSGNFFGGSIVTDEAGSIAISGDFGDPDEDVRGEAMVSVVSADSFRVTGDMRGALSALRGITTVTVGGAIDNGLLHAGGGFGTITAASVTESRISAGDTLTSLNVAGDFFDSSVMIGGDLGDDAEIGGSRLDADQVSAGFIGSVTIGGDFEMSDIVAGYLRGPDGFFGTADDLLASGRSSIGSVSVGGQILGSNRDSESYRIASTGAMGPVTEAGSAANNDRNLRIAVERLDPLPIQIEDVSTTKAGRIFVATLTFNQPIDFSSLTRALSISEVRGEAGDVEIRLIQGVDYTLQYRAATNEVVVTFAPGVSEHDLPQVTDEPGPGIYRFALSEDFVRGRGVLAELDGDGNGRVGTDDRFSADDIIGDPGDKLTPGTFTIDGENGFPSARVDMYGPLSLDIVLDGNTRPDGLPDANVEFTISGAIGDHADHDPNYFSLASDTDIYSITLQAGQILRLGAMQGPAQFAGRFLAQANGQILGASSDAALLLPFEPVTIENRELTFSSNYLIRQTGTYHIVVGNTTAFQDASTLPNVAPVPGGVGEYNFTVTVFDDGDTGFNAATDSGNGQDLVNAPAPSAFAGDDGRLGTDDDRQTIVNGAYVFRYSRGPDGVAGTTDDFVSGGNGTNVSSMTNAVGTRVNSVDAAIGAPGAAGLPRGFSPDVDVFHLNGGTPIATGSVVRATLKLSELGSDLGSRLGGLEDPILLTNYVQFAIFDTSAAQGADDALLLFAPTDAAPTSGEPGVIAESNNVTYGYDANGDFFIEFVAPGRQDAPGANASYAIYVQGVINSDYRLEVVTSGSRSLVERTQNILLEVEGGSVQWLEVGGVTTPIGPFVPSAIGFTGVAPNGQQIDRYIIERVTDIMQDTFDSVLVGAGSDGVFGTSDDERGLDINVSTDPSDFEFQDFSTIFITSSLDPVEPIFAQDGLFALAFGDDQTTQPFGVSEHSDPGNADRNDEAVVFIPSFTILGYTPSAADLESFTQSLAAAAARRAGELMGLRITEPYSTASEIFDVMAVNSPTTVPGDSGEYDLLAQRRRLSDPNDLSTDSDFFLGYQNAAQLLRLYVRDA